MSHFAKVINGIVTEVIVAEQEVIDSLPDSEVWLQTSYNTYGNTHFQNNPFRKNYAGIGFTYDAELDAFIPPKLQDDAILNTETGLWEIDIVPEESGNISIIEYGNLQF